MLLAGQVVVQQYFDKKRSLAAGVTISGSSWGFLINPPLARVLIDTYTWRGSYYIYAGLICNGVVFASLLRPVPSNKLTMRKPAKCARHNTKKCQLKYLNWFLYSLGISLLACGHMAPPVYFPVKAHYDNINSQNIPFLISVIGLTGIFMRPLAGFLGDLKYINRLILSAIAVTLSGASMIITTQISGFAALMSIAVIIGILQGKY